MNRNILSDCESRIYVICVFIDIATYIEVYLQFIVGKYSINTNLNEFLYEQNEHNDGGITSILIITVQKMCKCHRKEASAINKKKKKEIIIVVTQMDITV